MSEWKMVPVEPTPEMMAAGFCVSEAEHDPAGVYRAMLSAAPQPEQRPVDTPMTKLNNALFAEQWGRLNAILGIKGGSIIDTVDEVERRLLTAPQPTEQEAVNSLERECNALTDKTIEQRRLIEDLASMCRRMSYALNRAGGSDTTVRQCIDLLKRHDLGGSIIRTEQVAKPTDSGREG